MNVALAILFLATAGSGAINTPDKGTLISTPSTSIQTPWDAVQLYIANHATQTDAVTEALLKAEATVGVATWSVFGGGIATELRTSSPLDGPGLGWPAAGRVVYFATKGEALFAAALIMEATVTSPNPPQVQTAPWMQTRSSGP